ncbi:succinate dehydrogenase/fumarate reductase iron-sulfur subunit [Elizabethkingia sp. HX WHF]|jgi:succinate dehydrogenase / fumarate reductase iron-sulfur subunit|uniref:Succinate dehydrogenase / fumarate reductase iron-sulfur subunit n=1 Tax=Elizabethkingia miricola TaxID=172045 RepID=A0ABY3NI96_ELIMR|nr:MULTISPECIES: succinate dehydrogenase/fumarate reductase iron-sulfur subunit [Elizabethkingia]AJW63250.1 Fumarate reductase iron-sulfur subunit [Elizabethkingia miricola]ATL45232.1 succinate dehydrogenase/fumarate reductase iron-sulfur subunit [Elizabethkingia miricola]MCL1639927.1 succinate dehydrogenase/fumarate reductase iron-sulfur subunit [Elizabethkingia bruuniana]MDX8566088.1 succinate dehydrogenase/fumarate reductase iron-sulfur subunit [Elizabethkingia sp. HX WHF]MDX8566505.1 succi
MQLYLKIWRQKDRNAEGKLEEYKLDQLNSHMSFLEMLDTLNEKLILEGKEPVEFDHDCREGICGQCGMMINGIAHGPLKNTTTCQLHLRSFEDGDTIVIEPFRAAAFPVKKDLKVDRSALDRIIASGGFVSVNTGQAPDAKTIAITHQLAEEAFDAAACIGCGACVATCKNASAALFTSAKISHMALLPQGKEERNERVVNMVKQMDEELFGHCSNTEACEVECPQGISVLNIARMNYEYSRALFYKKN